MKDIITNSKKILLLCGDIIALYVALFITLVVRYGYPLGDLWNRHLQSFSIVILLWLIILFINGMYELKISYNFSSLANFLIKVFLFNLVAAAVFFYIYNALTDSLTPQRVLLIYAITSLILVFSWRRFFFLFLKSKNIANRVLIIGNSKPALELHNEINRRKQLGYFSLLTTDIVENLNKYCKDNKIDILVTDKTLNGNKENSKKIFDCLSLGIDVYSMAGFYEQITGKVPVEYIEHSWFLENLSEHSKKIYEISKRMADIFLSIVGLIVAIIITPFIAVIIKIDSQGPIIFKQTRLGKNGKQFTAMKFRSMIKDAEKHGARWADKNDSRITRFGKIMRKTRLDEIPQLINILKGDMSFVGPRPERPEFVSQLTNKIPFYKERLLVKPGLAGWAQIYGPSYGGSLQGSMEKLKYDLYYIKNRNLLLDLSIILKTIKVVFNRSGQ